MARFDIEGEEVVDATAKAFGNGAHVTVPKAWRGAAVKVVRVGDAWTPTDGLAVALAEGFEADQRAGIARLPAELVERLGLTPGDAVEIAGEARDVTAVYRADRTDADRSAVFVDETTRRNVGADWGDEVTVRPASPVEGRRVVVAPVAGEDDPPFGPGEGSDLRTVLDGRTVVPETVLAFETRSFPPVVGSSEAGRYAVLETGPGDAVAVTRRTAVEIRGEPADAPEAGEKNQ